MNRKLSIKYWGAAPNPGPFFFPQKRINQANAGSAELKQIYIINIFLTFKSPKNGLFKSVPPRRVPGGSSSRLQGVDEPVPEDLMERQWVPFQKIRYQFPEEFVRWLMNSGYYKESILLVDIKDDDFFEEYYVPKRIRLVDTCDRTGALTEDVQIASNHFYIPHLMLADADGYYSVLLPKHKWNASGKVSVSVPDYHEKTLSLDPFYKEGPFNTRNDIALVPNRRTITLEITRAEDVMERSFHLTYVIESTKTIKLNPYFKDNDLFTETLSVPAGMSVSSFSLNNDWRYTVNLVAHVQDSDHQCDELIRLQIERTAD